MDEALDGAEDDRLPGRHPALASRWAARGGGIAYNPEEFEAICKRGLDLRRRSELLIEESLIGWKEFEMEVVRDKADNCIIVCSIENLDPMGVHTGDSITVAPAQTLTDKEYQIMRDASIAVLREIGVDTGGSNVQFAINPEDGRMIVIEMNPRVSRSSALASKATGFPIAKVAAKLAVGYTLDELRNDITGGATPASFEPTIDYVVTKIPRFAFEKFPQADDHLTTQMKSVGEVMAIGRTFQESFQKALRGLEVGVDGLNEKTRRPRRDRRGTGRAGPGPHLVRRRRVRAWHDAGRGLRADRRSTRGSWCRSRKSSRSSSGWSSAALADARRATTAHAQAQRLLRPPPGQAAADRRDKAVRAARHALGMRPVYKRVDTCAAEFATDTAYMYSTYEDECEAEPTDRKKIMVLGGGPNRIGQGIEFDYCCVHAALGAARRRLRDHHGQLQPGDGVDRLRHLRPPVLRAADAGRRARDRRQGKAARRDRAVRRPDAAEAGAATWKPTACRSSAPRRT